MFLEDLWKIIKCYKDSDYEVSKVSKIAQLIVSEWLWEIYNFPFYWHTVWNKPLRHHDILMCIADWNRWNNFHKNTGKHCLSFWHV